MEPSASNQQTDVGRGRDKVPCSGSQAREVCARIVLCLVSAWSCPDLIALVKCIYPFMNAGRRGNSPKTCADSCGRCLLTLRWPILFLFCGQWLAISALSSHSLACSVFVLISSYCYYFLTKCVSLQTPTRSSHCIDSSVCARLRRSPRTAFALGHRSRVAICSQCGL